jgi:hypothetical protein
MHTLVDEVRNRERGMLVGLELHDMGQGDAEHRRAGERRAETGEKREHDRQVLQTVDTVAVSRDTDDNAGVDTGDGGTAAECADNFTSGARKMSGPKMSARAETLALFLVAWSGTSA